MITSRFITFAVACFAFLALSNVAQAQTWTGTSGCWTITVKTPTSNCAQACSGNNCNKCVTFTMTNPSNACGNISELTIAAVANGSIGPTQCFSVCCPAALGAPISTSCSPGDGHATPPTITFASFCRRVWACSWKFRRVYHLLLR